MTIAERNNKLKYFITCLKCEVSGKCCDNNCSTQYDAGNMGEIIENLEAISKALEQESVLGKIRAEIKALSPEPTAYDVVDGNPIKDAVWETLADVLNIIDKYKADVKPQESEDQEQCN